MNDLVLTGIINYGASVFGVVLFLGAAGVPLPTSLFVLAAGAFTRQGLLDGLAVISWGWIGTVLGDSTSYSLGYFAKGWVHKHIGHSSRWQTAKKKFNQYGPIMIYLTRWLITGLGTPTNLIAANSDYPFWRFLIYVLGGEFTWILLYGSIGYAVGSQWELISPLISDFSGLLAGIAILAGAIYMLIQHHEIVEQELKSL